MTQLERNWNERGSRSAAAVLILFLSASSAVVAADADRLRGSWTCLEEGSEATLLFQSKERLLYNGEASSYELMPGNVIRLQGEDGPADYYYQFDDGALTILSPDGSLAHCRKDAEKGRAAQRAEKGEPPAAGVPTYEKPGKAATGDESDPASLLYKFAGKWSHYTPNTETHLYLKPDGTFSQSYDASYGGEFHDQGGYQVGAWGAAGAERGAGRWKAEGTLKRGQLTLTDAKGNTTVYEYRVHVKNGEYFWGEYFFNGKLYAVTYVYR